MHPNPAFRDADAGANLSFARERGFGVLTLPGSAYPLASHIPFVLDTDGRSLGAHIVRSNPIRRQLAECGEAGSPALLIVSGADAYISPDWYGIDDQVPTWNYVAIHVFGTVRLLAETDLRAHLEMLSEVFESRLAPKPVWRLDKVSDEAYQRLARQIVPIRFDIERVEGTWKLSQNKSEAARNGAIVGLQSSPVGIEVEDLRSLMEKATSASR